MTRMLLITAMLIAASSAFAKEPLAKEKLENLCPIGAVSSVNCEPDPHLTDSVVALDYFEQVQLCKSHKSDLIVVKKGIVTQAKRATLTVEGYHFTIGGKEINFFTEFTAKSNESSKAILLTVIDGNVHTATYSCN